MSGLGGMMGRKGSLWQGPKSSRDVSGVVALLDTRHSKGTAELLVSSPALISAPFSLVFCLSYV